MLALPRGECLSLGLIASRLGGKVRGNKVVAPGPEAATKKGGKRRKHSLTVWINSDGDIGVNSWRGQDPIMCKDWVRARCNLPAWAPPRREPPPKRVPALETRAQFLSESLKIVRYRRRITARQFGVIINDMKNALPQHRWRARASIYAAEFKMGSDDLAAALKRPWRAYKATERAEIFKITYEEYRALGLRRSGCAELSPAERRRLTKQRYNAKRRDDRAAKRSSKSATEAARLPVPDVGTVRRFPSSEVVSVSRPVVCASGVLAMARSLQRPAPLRSDLNRAGMASCPSGTVFPVISGCSSLPSAWSALGRQRSVPRLSIGTRAWSSRISTRG